MRNKLSGSWWIGSVLLLALLTAPSKGEDYSCTLCYANDPGGGGGPDYHCYYCWTRPDCYSNYIPLECWDCCGYPC